MRKEHISIWQFKNIMNKCWRDTDGAKGARVIFYVGKTEYYVSDIGQFRIMPDVTIELKKVKRKKD